MLTPFYLQMAIQRSCVQLYLQFARVIPAFAMLRKLNRSESRQFGCINSGSSGPLAFQVRGQGAISIPIPTPMIASDMMITSTSIVSHVGMRFAGRVIARASAAHVMHRMTASGCEWLHTSLRARPEWRRSPSIGTGNGLAELDRPRQKPGLCRLAR